MHSHQMALLLQLHLLFLQAKPSHQYFQNPAREYHHQYFDEHVRTKRFNKTEVLLEFHTLSFNYSVHHNNQEYDNHMYLFEK